jgi:pyridoxal phosphate enzyme (YggS family)
MVAARLRRVRDRIDAAAKRSGRDPGSVTLVAVSKGHSAADIMAAYEAGHRDFGENRAQEFVDKLSMVPDDATWHFVGSVQRRKVKLIAPAVSLLHSLDRPSLISAWGALDSPPPALLQIDVAGEAQKHGFAPGEAAEAAAAAHAAGIPVVGVMTIPPLAGRPEDSRPWFDGLRRLRDELRRQWPQVRELSMGMTDDYEVAVECGATIVRVGRAIFEPVTTGSPADPR